MRKYLTISVCIVAAFTSCRKDSFPASDDRVMPVQMIRIKQKLTEVSKTAGSTASVVLISGYGTDMSAWQHLYRVLSPTTTVFAYNRAGIGASEAVPGPRDAATIAAEMKEVLESAGVKPPYVLVAHSMGGIYARMFYHLNPGKVKGIVLVDATHENQLDSLLNMIPQPDRDMITAEMTAAYERGLDMMQEGPVKEEFRANFSLNYRKIRQYPAITGIPLYVITSTKVTPDNSPFTVAVQKALHEQWALDAGANGRFLATGNSGHNIQVEEPGLVAEGIRWILSK